MLSVDHREMNSLHRYIIRIKNIEANVDPLLGTSSNAQIGTND